MFRSDIALPSLVQLAVFLTLATVAGTAAAHAQGARFLHQPDVSASRIVFVHANDLWMVGRDGGRAVRLTSSEGAEIDPAFSPDGQWVAFTGQYEGNTDVYLIPSAGGQPQRLTWHPAADFVQGWTPDGAVLFQSNREASPTMRSRFYTVPPAGGLPAPLALPQAHHGGMSADGAYVAYQEIGYFDPEWRNYRGGQAQPVGIVSTATWDRATPPWEGERQMDPVWMDGAVYYLSERDWASNVWSFDPRTGVERQLTEHSDFDVKSLGAGAGVVVYEQAGYLHELDPASGRTRKLEIDVAGDMNWSRRRWTDVPATRLRDARLSPTGKRALFEWRGELFSVPAGNRAQSTRTRGGSPSGVVAGRRPHLVHDAHSRQWRIAIRRGRRTAPASPGSTTRGASTASSSPSRTARSSRSRHPLPGSRSGRRVGRHRPRRHRSLRAPGTVDEPGLVSRFPLDRLRPPP